MMDNMCDDLLDVPHDDASSLLAAHVLLMLLSCFDAL